MFPTVSFNIDDVGQEEYPKWELYITKETYDPESPTVTKMKAIELHFKMHKEIYDLTKIKSQFWFNIKLHNLSDDNIFIDKWRIFFYDLTNQPQFTLGCMGLAMHKLICSLPDEESDNSSDDSFCNEQLATKNFLRCIRPRIDGYKPIIPLQHLKMNYYDRLVAIRGSVIRLGSSEIYCTWMAYKCSLCGNEQVLQQEDGIMTVPSSCKNTSCKGRKNFDTLLSSPFTRTEPYQLIRLQESQLTDEYIPGRAPGCIEVELTEDLVDSISPGDDITVTGILKMRPQEKIERKGQPSAYVMYIKAVAVAANVTLGNLQTIEFTEKDLEAIHVISKEPSTLKLLVHSLCPVIYGYELVKAGLLLSLFGGSDKMNQSGRRSDIHILIMGDPGIGKSRLLKECANVAPKGIFVCGSSCSDAGLTVTIVREKSGGSSIEPGALVLADQGTCCIDELDEMGNKQQSLLEVMEQQSVSVAKAGVQCKFDAKTTILAAANPVDGHYNQSKTLTENVKMNPALLSRFDLIYVLIDQPNRHFDSKVREHIQALQSKKFKLPTGDTYARTNVQVQESAATHQTNRNYIPIEIILKKNGNEEIDLLPPILIKKYIAYSKKNINPVLSTEAAQEIRNFYLELRSLHNGAHNLPVTIRQLEGLIRLTQARARIDLSTEATIEHALDVRSIVQFTRKDLFDNHSTFEMPSQTSICGKSQTTQIKHFLGVLESAVAFSGATLFNVDELKELASISGVSIALDQILDRLSLQGYIIKKGNNIYKFLTQ